MANPTFRQSPAASELLFDDAAGEAPPLDAIEFYLEPMPLTLSALNTSIQEDP